MKYLNRFVAILVITTSVFCMQSTKIFAAEESSVSVNKNIDYYKTNYSEIINLDGTSYRVSYSYDELDNQCIDIVNVETNSKDTVLYDVSDQKLYCDNKQIMTITNTATNNAARTLQNLRSSSNWILFSSSTKTISSIETMTSMVFVAAVAAIVGTACTAAMVLANMGATAVNYIISKFEKAKVALKVYKLNSSLITQFRYDWSVKPVGGRTYGPYTTMGQVY